MSNDIRKAAEQALRPCPFCGGEPYSCRHLSYSNWGVTCQCGATGPTKNAGYRPLRDAEIRAHNEAVEAWNQRAALAAEQPQPEAQPVAENDCHDCEQLRDKMADLLTRTANALRGDPPPLTRWSWHDLPDRAAAAIAAIDVMQRAAAAPPPAAPEPSEAEVAAAMASLYRAMEPAAWPSEDEVTDALRAAAAARKA